MKILHDSKKSGNSVNLTLTNGQVLENKSAIVYSQNGKTFAQIYLDYSISYNPTGLSYEFELKEWSIVE